MRKLFIAYTIVLLSTSCSTYIKNPRKLDLKPISGEINQSIEGQFKDMHGDASLWRQIKKSKKNFSKSIKSNEEIIELSILSSKIIKLRLMKNQFVKDSIYISGTFTDNSFAFDTKRGIEDIFPLFWRYEKAKFSIRLDSSNNLVLLRSGSSMIFLLLVPIMAADGDVDFTYKRKF